MKTLYVGNIPSSSSADDVRQAFAAHGKVHSVKLIADWLTGKHRGFGFVKMGDDEASAAIDALNEKTFCGHNLRVDIAQDLTQ